MIFIINQANLYLKGISKKGDNIMKIYKNYLLIWEIKISWDLSYSFSTISAALIVYGYYLIYKNLIEKQKWQKNLFIRRNKMDNKKLRGKDVITIGIFTAIYFAINFGFMLLEVFIH